MTLTACALAQAALDLALLERRMNYLRGGFLAWEHLRGPGDTALFVLAAVLGHVAVVGPPVWIGLLAARRIGIHRNASVLLAVSIGIGVTAAATLAAHEVVRYLGDLANLSVLFALAGRSASELIAVSAEHLSRPTALAAIASAALGFAAWWLHRGDATPLRDTPGALRGTALVAVVALMTAGVHVTARVVSETLEFGLARTASGVLLGQLTQHITDVDGDGFGWLQRPPDPDNRVATIHPYALDIPGNGIDENGVGGDLPPTLSEYAEPPVDTRTWTARPDVVVVLLESVRADAVGTTLDGKPVTPALDALSARGVFTREAWAHNGFTSPARRHFFTGSLAGLRGSSTLIDDFKAQGYEIAYFSGQDEDFGGPAFDVGMRRADRWFHAPDAPGERYTRFTTPGSLALPFDAVERRVVEFLRERSPERPLLLIVNFHDTHFPYTHAGIKPILDSTIVRQGDIAPGTAEPLRRMYLNTLANVDAAIARVLDALPSTTGAAPALVVTSDHGESLFDDGTLGHGFTLASAQNRVPLIVAGLGLDVPVPFGHADLRDLLYSALRSRDTVPRLVSRTAGPVMQYVGSLHEPAAIGWVTAAGSLVYDFRQARVRRNGGPWQAPADLTREENVEFHALIHTWERIRLAQSEAGVSW